jgi:hypothetical protein
VSETLTRAKGAMISARLNTKDWKKSVEKFAAEATKQGGTHSQAIRSLFFRLLEKVILKSPVDTGRARGGWGAAPGVKLPPATPLPPKTDQTAEGLKLSTYSENLTGPKLKMALVNAVEYIEALEKGHSLQAPIGMVRISEMELQQEISGKALPAAVEALYEEAAARTGMTKAKVSSRARGLARALGLMEGNA